MAKKSQGIIYDIGKGKYGLALNHEQKPAFKMHGKVFMRQYNDILCQVPDMDPQSGSQYIALKHINSLRQVGFQD